jgi:hypothetical protein
MKRKNAGNLDRMLSERLAKAVGEERRADWLDVLERAEMSRTLRHWSQRRVLLVSVTVVLAAAACAGSTGVIPWLNHHPLKVEAPTRAAPCHASGLRVHLDYTVNPQETDGQFTLENVSRGACSLAGRARVALIDPRVSGPRLNVIYKPQPKPQPGALDFWPPSLLRAVPPGKAVVASFTWRNWCGPRAVPKAVELRLQDGERIVRSFASSHQETPIQPGLSKVAPRCNRPRGRTSFEYSDFFPAWTPDKILSTYRLNSVLPLRAKFITKGLETIRERVAPGMPAGTFFRLQRGSVFHYRIALRSTSRRPFHFTKCPLYREMLTGHNNSSNAYHSEALVLNCSPVGMIKPDGQAYFAMELHVPKNQQLGESDLMWLLMDGNSASRSPDINTWVVP